MGLYKEEYAAELYRMAEAREEYPSPEELAEIQAELALDCRCPPMTDAEIDARAAMHGRA